MENVVAFNNELSGLYESKPPISKAKMSAITRSAMRAIKFYKHVVQSVEKFILKCKPEYKVPGLYVIDSIVRQSRHQFGPEKDVFAPRFARNMKETFANLFRCAPEDKSRIIRVLNLWQKNNVFAPEVIQPIFDLADPNHPIYSMPPVGAAGIPGAGNPVTADVSQANGLNTSGGSLDAGTGSGPQTVDDKLPGGSGGLADLSSVSPHERSRTVSSRQLDHKQHSSKRTSNSANMASTSNSKSREHSKSTLESIKIHHPETYSKYQRNSSHDYEDTHHIVDDDDGSSVECDSTKNSNNLLDNNNLKQLLNDPNVLRQLQTLQNFTKFKQDDKQQHLRMQEEAFEKHLQNVLKNTATGSSAQQESKEVEFVSEEMGIEVINLDGNDSRSPTPDRGGDRYNKRRRSRSRSRSRDRGARRRRSRSRTRTRSRSPRTNRRRNSRDRERNNRDKEKDRELERERRKKGLPDMKKDHLSVCSTTLWVGHLSKLVYQEELSDTFGEYGDIVSIDQIVPRGCAFIVMNRRQDAFKAMQGLKSHKLQGRAITISWAAGKGVKSKEWKDFWDLELGVTYIPWNKLNENTDFDALEEGGMFDEDTMPGWMKEKKKKLQEKAKESTLAGINLASAPNVPPPGNPPLLFNIDTTQPPPGPPPTGGPPPMLPMVPGQFSMAPPMGAPPRMMGAPPHMGMPISGLHMPPNIVPPHAAMMMMPGFGMPGQVPPSGGPPIGAAHLSPMGAPQRHPAQFPPPMSGVPPAAPVPASAANVSSDDQMDIEMDEEDGAPTTDSTAPPSGGNTMNFNQPPPSFSSENSLHSGPNTSDNFGRDRNRGGGGGGGGGPNSRWGGRGASSIEDDGNEGGGGNSGRWRENGANGPNFGDGGRNRHEFMNEYDNRGGPRGGGPNFNNGGDFHPNMQNRFNQPTNLMQMRIPPPNAFNQRGGGPGGPHMFMRGQGGGPGGLGGPGGPGGRQQSPGFFNRNNAFERVGPPGGGDMGAGFGGRGRGGRGGMGGMGGRGGGRGGGMDGRGGRDGGGGPIWSDDEGDENVFKRRGGGVGVNRFRDDDRHNNMRDRGGRGGRGGLGGPGGRDRNDGDRDNRSQGRDNRSQSRDNRSQGRDNRSQGRGLSEEGNLRSSRDDIKNKPPVSDTEEDWDNELEDLQEKNEKKSTTTTTINTFGGDDDDGTRSPFRGDSGKTRRNSEKETPMVIQIKNKVVDPDEENWDDDDEYDNRPLPINTQQEVRQASPTPPASASNVSNTENEQQMSSEIRASEDIIRKESPVRDQHPGQPPPAIIPSSDASPLSTSSAVVSALASENAAAAETEA